MYFGLHGLQSLLGVVFCEDQIVSKQTAHIIFCMKPSPTLDSPTIQCNKRRILHHALSQMLFTYILNTFYPGKQW